VFIEYGLRRRRRRCRRRQQQQQLPKLRVLGKLTSKWGAVSKQPQKAHPCMETCRIAY